MPHQMVNFVKIFQHNFYLPQIETESEVKAKLGFSDVENRIFRKISLKLILYGVV